MGRNSVMEDHAEQVTVLNYPSQCQAPEITSAMCLYASPCLDIHSNWVCILKTVEQVIVVLRFNEMQYAMSTRQGIGTWEEYECGTCDQRLISEPISLPDTMNKNRNDEILFISNWKIILDISWHLEFDVLGDQTLLLQDICPVMVVTWADININMGICINISKMKLPPLYILNEVSLGN